MKVSPSPFAEGSEDLHVRHAYLPLAALGLFLLLLVRLWYLQIIRGPEFRVLSESNWTRVQDTVPSRGLILDRHGQVLVDNHPAYDLAVVREDVSDPEALAASLSRVLDLPGAEVQQALAATRSARPFKPAVVHTDLSPGELVTLETHRFELPGVVIRVKPRRKYVHEGLAAHVIGYLGEVSPEQLRKKEYRRYRMGDLVGQYGLEREWESYLHGRRGRRVVEVDASGRVLNVIKEIPPEPGRNLYLTLDARLQRVAQEALRETAGAVVALDPQSGEVLAMASSPTFSQNVFVRGLASEEWQALVNDPLDPLENRALGGQYAPGSTFKIVTAIAALEEGLVTPETTFTCQGSLVFGNRTYRCWRKGGHGKIALHRALVESCDVYFYEIGRHLSVDRLARYSRALGLGRPTGVGSAHEKPGLVPTAEWKRERHQAPWHKGETLSVVIGQGYNLVTPLQMAVLMAAVANGGTLYRPHLVKRITDAEGREVKSFRAEVVRRLPFTPQTLSLIREALVGVVNEPTGTGRRARLPGVEVMGKTGTAQVVAASRFEEKKEDLPYKYRDHAWFVAAAPAGDPEIALAVVVEHSGHGGSVAAPLARQVLEAFFTPTPPAQKTARERIDRP